MNTNKISFGRVIKVNAPFPIAMQVEELANSSENRELNQAAKKIFNDITPEGKARVHSSFDNPNTSYILSGKDSEEFTHLTAKDNDYNMLLSGCTIPDIATAKSWPNHIKIVKDFISKNLENGSVNVATKRSGEENKIVSIDFVA